MNSKYKMAIAVVIFLFFPLIVERFVINGFFGFRPFPTEFTPNEWFSFWASYLGGGLTIAAIWVSILINNKNLKNELEKEQREIKNEFDKQRLLLESELEKQRVVFENEVKKEFRNEVVKLKKAEIIEDYADIIRDIDSLCETIMIAIPVASEYISYHEFSFPQKIARLLEESAYFQRKYRNEYGFQRIIKILSNIQQDFEAISNEHRMLNREDKEKASDLGDKLTGIITKNKLLLRDEASRLKDDLIVERDETIPL